MTDKTYFRSWELAGILFAGLALLLGSIGLAGWIYHEPALRSLWGAGTEMKFNTALCVTLLGGSLLLSCNSWNFTRKPGIFLAAVLFLLASLTLLECLFGFNLGIDELFFKDTNLFRTLSPGRMAAQSAATFMLQAVGIYFMRSTSRRRVFSQSIALVSLFFPAQALAGYALGKMAIAGLGPQSSYMAVPTALAFVCGALALLLREPASNLMASLTARTPASQVFRRQLICAVFLPIVLGLFVLHNTGAADGHSAEYCIATFAWVIMFVFVALTWANAAQLNAAAKRLAQRDVLLHESQERYRTLFNSIDEGFCLVEMIFDESGRAVDYLFLEVNPSFTQQTGFVDAVGKRVSHFVPHLENDWLDTFGKVATSGQPVRFQNDVEGMQRSYEVFAFRFGAAEQREVAIVFNDVTARKRSEENLALIAAISQDLAQLRTVEEIMRAVGLKIGEHLKLSICCFVEINETADICEVTHEWRRDANVPSLLGRYQLADYLSADFQKILRGGDEFVVNDTQTDPRTDAKNYEALQLRSFVCVPLVREGEWKFMFNIHHSTPHEWRADEIELVREITTRLWTRLERAHADATLQKKEKELQVVSERLQLATKAAGIGAFEWDIQADVNYWTPELEALYGLPPGGFTGRNGGDWARYLHPEDREEALALCLQAIEQCSEFNTEFRVVWPDGTVRWLAGRAQVVCDPAGKPWRLVGVNMDITEKKREARASQQLAAIVESSEDAIISKDLNSIITSWNRGAEQLFGYQAAEVMGKPITILMPRDRLNEEPKILERIRRGEPINHYETIRQRKDGSLVEISLTVSPLKDATGKVIGASKIARDVTKQKQAERELEQSHKEAVAASRAKDDFLAALSHELRTPLNPALLIASEAAENRELPEAVRQNFETIRKNIELEARLIDDLLDLTRIISGKLALEKSPLDIHAVLVDAIATIQSEQQAKEIQLVLELHAQRFFVEGDAVRLQQVFWNVLKNAVKFTPQNGRITVETFSRADILFIKISDTGIGMSPDELARVFTAFAQGDHAGGGGSHRFGGLGLGLAISKNLVELHAGKISAASAGSNQGSAFTIELPLTLEIKKPRPDASAPAPGAGETSLAQVSPLTVLLVEDHEATRTVLAQLLVRRNYQVVTAGSLNEARQLALQNKFSLLISDIGLPDGNGNDLMNEFRARYGMKGIALTGYGMEEDIARGKTAGFVTHLIKPVRMESLENALSLVKKLADATNLPAD